MVDGKLALPPVSIPAQGRNKVAGEVRVPYHRLPCVHCGQLAAIRTSTRVTRLTRKYVFCCTTPECGHTLVALMDAKRVRRRLVISAASRAAAQELTEHLCGLAWFFAAVRLPV